MSKKKKQPEYHKYVFCLKCGKAFCRGTDLPNLDYNYCPNCGNNLTDMKTSFMKNMNQRRAF